MITKNSSIDEVDGEKIYSKDEADLPHVNKVNNNNKNNGTYINDRVAFNVNSQLPHHHQQKKMEEQLKDAKSTDQKTKKVGIISGDDVNINNETLQNGSTFSFDPNQPSKLKVLHCLFI